MLKWKGNYGYIGSLCIATVLKKPGAAHFETIYMPVEMVGVYGMETEEAAREVAERDTLEWLKSQGLQPIPEKSDLPTEEIKNVCHDICGKNLCYTCPLNFSDNHCYYDDIWWVTYADKINAAIAANRVKLAEGNSNESQRKVQP